MLPGELENVLERVPFRDPASARHRLGDLAGDEAERTALCRLAPRLGDALSTCADPDRAITSLERFVHAHGSRWQLYGLFADLPSAFEALVHVVAASQYLADVLVRNPEFFGLLCDSGELGRPRGRDDLTGELGQACEAFGTVSAKLNAIRRFRRRQVLRIGTADLRRMMDLTQTVDQLSALAEAVVAQCLKVVACRAETADLIVLALGKLGGGELNYSSDIDLVLVAPHRDRLYSATRLAQRLVDALSEHTAEGFLYRVDLRLRPYGRAGLLVVPAEAFADYLTTRAHAAERQAMLRARVVAGNMSAGQQFMERVQPRLFADAQRARQEVRRLKERIERQLQARGHADGHVKLAPGGIRDVEFIVQALQLERGGQQTELLTGNTLTALTRLAAAGILASDDAACLQEGYCFLRQVEHRLQLMDNQQVHELPKGRRELEALARSLGYSGPRAADQLAHSYQRHTQTIRSVFDRLLPEQ